jgi:beta-phosphoglucomutase-like phosphatase (HAD superfamily)
LDYLVARGIPRTIATASEKPNLDFFVEHLSLGRWFDPQLMVYDDGEMPGKPAPDMYLNAAGRLGLKPGRCVVVEDSLAGIAAARAAGIGFAFALGPADRHARLRRLPGVGGVVEHLGQIPRDELF